MSPDIETERLRLIRYRAGLVTDTHVAWLNDPEVVKYSEQRHYRHTLESQHAYLNDFPHDSHIWLIKLVENDAIYHIGTITAYVDAPNKVANIGILIGQKGLWGRGYGHEAWSEVMVWLFANGIRKVECGCMSSNDKMINLAQRAGLDGEGCIPKHFINSDDLLLFGMLAP